MLIATSLPPSLCLNQFLLCFFVIWGQLGGFGVILGSRSAAVFSSVGYLGSSPDPGCEFLASTSPKNTGERSKTILFDEYDESEWSSLITNRDNFKLNKNTILPYSSSFDPVSSPSKHLLKIVFFTSFFI